MLYNVKPNDTWASVAQALTMGGSAYGPALANINDFPVGTPIVDSNGFESTIDSNSKISDVRDTINIPDDWLKPSGNGLAYPSSSNATKMYLGALAIIAFFAFKKNRGR